MVFIIFQFLGTEMLYKVVELAIKNDFNIDTCASWLPTAVKIIYFVNF